MDEGKNEASNMGFDRRGTPQKKFNSRLVAPTNLGKKPFGENVEGLFAWNQPIPLPASEFNFAHDEVVRQHLVAL
ncbi:MAG: hypothetical protein ACLQNE_06015 [Thermoguttaceae bacterium]